MIRTARSAWGVLLVCGVLLAGTPHSLPQSAATADPGWGLPRLMAQLARVRSAHARFTERKTLHLLNAPLISSGTLTYTAPDRIEKITVSPVPERFVLDGEQVTVSGGAAGRTQHVSLRRFPQIGGLVEGIRATLAGNLATLDRLYVVRFAGNAAQWQLNLTPRDPALARFVRVIRIAGSRNRIDEIVTEHGNGDISDMKVAETEGDGD